MLNEKHPDSSSWLNKLEVLDSLPGEERMDKQAAWEKLQVRMQEKPRRKKAVWYWAAACLMLVLLIQWMVAGKKEATFVNNKLALPQLKISGDTTLSQVQLKEFAAEKIFTVPQKQSKINNSKKSRIVISTNIIVKTKEPIVAAIANNPMPIEVGGPVQTQDTPNTTAVKSLPAKKKVRLVHINEIESPTDQLTFSFQREERMFTSKLGNNNIINDNAPQQREYTGILKIKISSKN